MKIGIMSMQRIINYGSFLQAYALSHTIRSLGHTVEFVDFKIEPCIVPPYISKDLDTYTGIDYTYTKKTREFLSYFEKQYLKQLHIDQRNERPNLDTLVIGSDEVFNCLQNNPDVGYSLELFGKDQPAKNIISYAASCGDTTYERLVSFHKENEIASLLQKFKSISVRDKNTKTFVQKLTGITPEEHLDPVLIYDFEKDIIDHVDLQDYIIVYAYALRFSHEECDAIRAFADKHHKKIISLGVYQYCTDIFVPAAPLEVLSYFQKADYIITDTFHGSIFSIKAHKPFATIIRNSNRQKLTDLLNRLQLSSRIVSSLDNLEEILKTPIDYTATDTIIEKEKQKTIHYLDKMLKN